MFRVLRPKPTLLTSKVALSLRTVATMPSPHPVILCGKTEAIGAVVIENLPHLLEGVALADMLDVRVPEAHAFEPGTRCCGYTVAEFERAVFLVRVRQGAAGKGPIGTDEIWNGHGRDHNRER